MNTAKLNRARHPSPANRATTHDRPNNGVVEHTDRFDSKRRHLSIHLGWIGWVILSSACGIKGDLRLPPTPDEKPNETFAHATTDDLPTAVPAPADHSVDTTR